MEHSPGDTGPPPRRGPSVDLDPTGIVTGKAPDRQRRQFLNYSFYRLDPCSGGSPRTSGGRRGPSSSNWCGSGSLRRT
jgi:hypothetical protein